VRRLFICVDPIVSAWRNDTTMRRCKFEGGRLSIRKLERQRKCVPPLMALRQTI
jgi:hypothetical protein